MNNKELAHYLHGVALELEHSQETFADSVEVILRRKKVKLNIGMSLPETIRFCWPAFKDQPDSQ